MVALIAAGASLLLGLLNLINQRRLEKLRKNLDFETLRFGKLDEAKVEALDLAESGKHSVELLLANRDEDLVESDKLRMIMEYQEKQAKTVALARQIYLRNKHLMDQDVRERLDEMTETMSRNAQAAMDGEDIAPDDVNWLLKERIGFLEGYVPELQRSLEQQLDRISTRLSNA